MKATAIAPANIAFIKYWGKKDATLRIPYNPSISMNLSACETETTVEFSADFSQDEVSEGFNTKRVIEHIDRLRKMSGVRNRVRVTTSNNFPSSSGIASSASGFAALTLAAVSALGLSVSEKELTAFARLGSGSACRSIPDGFVKWEGEYAYSLYPPDYWDLRDVIVIVEEGQKKISSTEGHSTVESSPFFAKRLDAIPKRIERLENALRNKNFEAFGEIIEEECLDMHAVMQTQEPPLYYWSEETKKLMDDIRSWRGEGLPVYFTIDAGPNVHVMCEAKDETRLVEHLAGRNIIINKPAMGASIV